MGVIDPPFLSGAAYYHVNMTAQDGFQLVPAVDVVGEEAVRLRRGAFDNVVAKGGDPAALVAAYAEARPPLIHVVDLDGARAGAIRPGLVRALVEAAGATPVQASGGIRSLADAEALLEAGASRVVVGTAVLAGDDALGELAAALGERLVVAVDARDGRVAVAGWTRTSELSPEELAERCAAAGVRRLLCTAIDRDGTMGGPDLDLLARVRERSGLAVLAAGGIRSEDDLAALEALGLEGAVVGRALLEGAISLPRP
jgi:phosphoribosylformimino-5-aminoimidazole carboxamide ribotide isomerase